MTTPYEAATDGAVDPDVDMIDEPTTSVATAPEAVAPVADEAPAPVEVDHAAVEVDEYDPVAEALKAISAEARVRGLRTLFQGALTSVALSVGAVGATYLRAGDLSHLDYKVLGGLALSAAGSGVVSYLHNVIGAKR